MAKELSINPRLIVQSAKATVKNLIDGVVELITNSDDSYCELEESGDTISGKIEIYVNRMRGGICKTLIIKDYAEGMTEIELIKALEFGGETSGFYSGKNVRGFFGRGLKETIIGLGEGEIITIKNNKKYRTKLWVDKSVTKYDDNLLKKSEDTNENNGTEIVIKITNEKIKIPESSKFVKQLSNHYALRNINSNPKRKINLVFEELSSRSKKNGPATTIHTVNYKPIVFIKNEKIEAKVEGFNESLSINITESEIPLDYQKHSPFNIAGILIKTSGAILDNQLFKFENEPAAYYFSGSAYCLGLETRLKKNETQLIDANRHGLDWGDEYCQALEKTIEKVLEPYIIKKRSELKQNKPVSKINESAKKMFDKLSNLLNQIAKEELGDEKERPPEPTPNILNLTIVPPFARVQKDKTRTLLVMAPFNLVEQEGNKIIIETNNDYIYPLNWTLNLEKSKKYPEIIYSGYFKVATRSNEGETTITVKLGKETDSAKITVAPPKIIGPRQKRKGGFISGFDLDNGLHTVDQRVSYEQETGIIYINIGFPSTSRFIKDGLEGANLPEGKMLLAELVGEVFFRRLAYESYETGEYIPGEGQIDALYNRINELQNKYLYKIQDIIFNWKF
ncbi:MAG: hypothetical protein ACD_79C00601G0004 [uncultured bacterium]|nr:MAG: hypothetical protein ACD_79C00601G0004 [uncultured bacterium]